MRIALIDAEASTRSGHLPEELCRQAMEMGHRALLCHSRGTCPKDIPSYIIGSWMKHDITFGFPRRRRKKPRVNKKTILRKLLIPRRNKLVRTVNHYVYLFLKRLSNRETSRMLHPRRDKLSSAVNRYMHLFLARLSDRQGFFSKQATRRLVAQLKQYRPDVVHLHNLHGYYLHLPTLLQYLQTENILVVWTLDDFWAFTGHCLYPTAAQDTAPDPEQEQLLLDGSTEESAFVENQLAEEGCSRWLTGCGHCAMKREYPESWFWDASARNWQEKRKLLSGFQDHLILAAPSQWLLREIKRSFLGNYPAYALYPGVNTSVFHPIAEPIERQSVLKRYRLDEVTSERFFLLSVADVWDSREGLDDLLALAKKLGEEYLIVAVGLEEEQRAAVPSGNLIALGEISDIQELCILYTAADLYVSLNRAEPVGARVLESLSCGTQVFTWQASAMPELLTPETGDMAPMFDLNTAAHRIRALCQNPKSPEDCRRRALEFDAGIRCHEYIRLYEGMYANRPSSDRETASRPD